MLCHFYAEYGAVKQDVIKWTRVLDVGPYAVWWLDQVSSMHVVVKTIFSTRRLSSTHSLRYMVLIHEIRVRGTASEKPWFFCHAIS